MPYSAGANSANFNLCADWNGQNGNVTTVGSNGGPSYYGTYDQSGNVYEWTETVIDSSRGLRGGYWLSLAFYLSSSGSSSSGPSSESSHYVGFRLSSVLNPLNLSYFVDIVDSGNVNDTTGYGAVSYNYKIAQYPVTNCEYAAFLNAIASTDPYALYNTNMDSDPRAGISRSGTSGSYSYTVKTNMGNKPVVYVSWFDAARYCNWLHNGKPSGSQNAGTTEDGAYTLNGANTGNAVSRNTNASYNIPTENEWYKAAYYKGGGTNAGYWIYATQSNSAPTCVTANSVGDGSLSGVPANVSDYGCLSILSPPIVNGGNGGIVSFFNLNDIAVMIEAQQSVDNGATWIPYISGTPVAANTTYNLGSATGNRIRARCYSQGAGTSVSAWADINYSYSNNDNLAPPIVNGGNGGIVSFFNLNDIAVIIDAQQSVDNGATWFPYISGTPVAANTTYNLGSATGNRIRARCYSQGAGTSVSAWSDTTGVIASPTPTATLTGTPTPTPTNTAIPNQTPTVTPTKSVTPSVTPTKGIIYHNVILPDSIGFSCIDSCLVNNFNAYGSDKAATLVWELDSYCNSLVKNFRIEYKLSSANNFIFFADTNNTIRNIIVNNLTNGSTYIFRLSTIRTNNTVSSSYCSVSLTDICVNPVRLGCATPTPTVTPTTTPTPTITPSATTLRCYSSAECPSGRPCCGYANYNLGFCCPEDSSCRDMGIYGNQCLTCANNICTFSRTRPYGGAFNEPYIWALNGGWGNYSSGDFCNWFGIGSELGCECSNPYAICGDPNDISLWNGATDDMSNRYFIKNGAYYCWASCQKIV